MNLKNALKKLLVFSFSTFFAVPSSTAAVQCYDTVNEVIVHSNGRIFFTTANSCSAAWCELAGSSTFMNEGYAMLMVSKIKNKTLYIQWTNLTSCDAKNVAYAIPEFLVLK